MKKQYPIELTLTNKMWKHFVQYPFNKDGELGLFKKDNIEQRYLNNFVEIGLMYEVLVDDDYGRQMTTTFYLTHVGKMLLKQYK